MIADKTIRELNAERFDQMYRIRVSIEEANRRNIARSRAFSLEAHGEQKTALPLTLNVPSNSL